MLIFLQSLLLIREALCAVLPPAPTLLSQPAGNLSAGSDTQAYCVNTGRYRQWNGRIMYSDCQRALAILKDQTIKKYDMLYAFYTPHDGFKPLSPQYLNWKLPQIITYRRYLQPTAEH